MSTAIAIAKEYASLIDLLETSDELTPEMIADTLEGMEGELGEQTGRHDGHLPQFTGQCQYLR